MNWGSLVVVYPARKQLWTPGRRKFFRYETGTPPRPVLYQVTILLLLLGSDFQVLLQHCEGTKCHETRQRLAG